MTNEKAPYLLRVALDSVDPKKPSATIFITAEAYQADLDRAYYAGRRSGLIDALWITATTFAVFCLAWGAVWWIAAGRIPTL